MRRGLVAIEDRSAADVIVEVDGEQVATAAEFLGHIENKKPGDVVEITVLRNGRRTTMKVTLGGETAPAA
jgi:S1-C subfamily serine protease